VDKLGKLLPGVIAKQPGRGRISELRVQMAFIRMIGETLAQSFEKVEVRGSVLTITTANPALAHQLRIDGESLLARLNAEQLGRRLLTLRVRTGRAHTPGSRD
jgi:hypothetical protein